MSRSTSARRSTASSNSTAGSTSSSATPSEVSSGWPPGWANPATWRARACSAPAGWASNPALRAPTPRAPRLHLPRFDPPPFYWLQGLFSLGAFFTTTVVLISQNRQTRFETQRLNLDLQLNLLTEQKPSKLIHLIKELRHDLPMVHDRHDAVAAAMQTPTDTARVLAALEQQQVDNTAAKPKE